MNYIINQNDQLSDIYQELCQVEKLKFYVINQHAQLSDTSSGCLEMTSM